MYLMNHVIEMKHIYWSRNNKAILKDINWQVRKGEHWAVLGLNGSGKSTILNIINGYIWPSKGQISVLGHPFGKVDLRELRKSIGWVSSSLQEKLYSGIATQDVVISGKFASIGLYDQPTEEDHERATSLMHDLSCFHLYDRVYDSCSQGEKQKILIARALMASPQLLILDEPCNGLDFISRESLLESINQIAIGENAPTILLVTHHVEEITPVFNRTLLIRNGQVFAKGTTKELLNRERLSEFFNTPIDVKWKNERAWLSILDQAT